jgi:hypothetical protein
VVQGSLNAYRIAPSSVEQLLQGWPDVAVVTVVAQLDDYWPPAEGADVLVASRFVLRVDEVVAGSGVEPGDELVVYTPGGTVARRGIAAVGGSLRPQHGEKTVRLEYIDWPPFRVGTRELVFLARGDGAGGEARWGAVPEGRFRLAGNRLETIFEGGLPPGVAIAADIRTRLVDRSLPEAAAEIQRTAATAPQRR